MEIDYKAIGQRIKIARIKKGITQESVANIINMTPSHMSNVETGKTKVSLPPCFIATRYSCHSYHYCYINNIKPIKLSFKNSESLH